MHFSIKLANGILLALLLTSMFCSCNSNEKYPYAIRDFKKEYRPFLTNVVSKSVVDYDTSSWYIQRVFTDKELLKLSNCEIPTLRALALEELTRRSSVDQFAVIKDHLDDTALVAKYMGEFGVNILSVTDNMIQETHFRDSIEESKIRELVIAEHSYLSSAYSILRDLPHNEKNYQIVLNMTKQVRCYREISDALFVLASYKKDSDILYINGKLSQDHRLFNEAFYILGEYPDSRYLPLIEKNCRRIYSMIYSEPFRVISNNQETALNLLNTMATYKTRSGALILDTIIHRSTVLNPRDTMTFREGIYDVVFKNACPEYAPIMKELNGYILKKRKDSIEREKISESVYFESDTTHYEPVIIWPRNRWIYAN